MAGWREITAEFAGMAILLALVISVAVAGFATGSPVVTAVPSHDLRRMLTGILTAGAATLIVYSPFGRTSGGHINPAVTLAFFLLGKLTARSATAYAGAQFAGAVTGALLALFVWGRYAADVRLGATVPAMGGPAASLGVETVMTFLLVTLILNFVDRPRLMPFTPAAAGLLTAVLIFTEAPVSGTSLNPARSFGPALVGVLWTGLWVYLTGPPLGALAAALLYRRYRGTVACGKLIHDSAYACRFLDCRYSPPAMRIHARPFRHEPFATRGRS
ncbi:aquaporin [Actinoallomurus liliacearum]|uniref:Aquaporin n=1 Tax=Actinoallomurus liliacearum TaxID=1080073 RepID=A0ABP8TP85_9ACTN